MPSLGCWCLAPESTLRHLWTSQNVRRRSVVGSGVEFTVVCRHVLCFVVCGAGKGVRCACGGGACTYRLVGCWGVARPLGEGQIVVLHRGHDVGERRCLPTVARRVRNPHRSFRQVACESAQQLQVMPELILWDMAALRRTPRHQEDQQQPQHSLNLLRYSLTFLRCVVPSQGLEGRGRGARLLYVCPRKGTESLSHHEALQRTGAAACVRLAHAPRRRSPAPMRHHVTIGPLAAPPVCPMTGSGFSATRRRTAAARPASSCSAGAGAAAAWRRRCCP